MKKLRSTEEQIIAIIKEQEGVSRRLRLGTRRLLAVPETINER